MTETLQEFALACYQWPGVAEACLHLQDNIDADINMLLTAAWLADQHYCWQHEQLCQLIALCADWRAHCILPLRAVRRYLKHDADLTALYAQAKSLEIDAETHQLHLLQDALRTTALVITQLPPADVLARNLQIYIDSISPHANSESELRALIEALTR